MDKLLRQQALIFICVILVTGILGEKRSIRHKRVIGGREISKGDRPWLVSLHGEIVTERLFGIFPIRHRHVYCGGSLLNDRYVLTAAHCFDIGREGTDADAWEVRLATVDLKVALADRFMDFLGKTLGNKDWRLWEMDVDRIIIHPGYKKEELWYQDIALVKLAEPVPSGPRFAHIKRIQLPDVSDTWFPDENSNCHMTGWGCTTSGGGISRYAMTVQLPILNNYVCNYYYHPKSMYGRLCAGFKSDTDSGGICPGDSGGPLVCQNNYGEWIQVGIASFTSRNRPEKFPAVFTRVKDYTSWIRNYIDH